MQIVIDIPEEDYNELIKRGDKTINLGLYLNLGKAVKNGIPLPKGHGKLIDVNEVKKQYPLEIDGLDLRNNNQCLHTAVDEAQVIVKADTESDKAESKE